MSEFDTYRDKAEDLAREHPDQVDKATDRAGDFADERTGRRFSKQIDEGEQRVDQFAEGGDGSSGQDDKS